MLTLDDFTTGRPWPPPEDAPRMARYKRNKLLFEGQLDKVYGRWVRLISGMSEETHYALNFPKRLSFLWADLVFGERPAITIDEPEPVDPEAQDAIGVDPEADPLDVQDSDPAASSAPRPGPDVAKNPAVAQTAQPLDPMQQPAVEQKAPKPKSTKQDKLNDLLDRVQLHVAGHESVIDLSRYGDAVLKLYRDDPEADPVDDEAAVDPTARPEVDDGEVGIEAVDPSNWYPIRNPYRPRKITAHVLAWEIDAPVGYLADQYARQTGKTPKRGKRLVVEVHERGKSTYRTYELEHGGKIGDKVDETTENTDLDVPLVFHIPGVRTSERLHGLDDYTAIDSPLEYLVWLMAARQSVILKHQDPSIVGPPGQLKEDETTGELVYDAGSAYFEIDDPQTTITPEYLTWDGKLDAAFTQTETLWNDLYTVTETSPAAFNATAEGYAESGTSLKLRMTAPLKKAERLTRNIDPVYRDLIHALAELDGLNLGDEVTIEWRDGLPSDDAEASEISERDIRAGLTSKLSERMRRYNMTEDQARQEQERIDEEARAAAPTFADRLLGMPAGSTGDDPNDPLGLNDPADPPPGKTPPQLASSAQATKRAFGKA